MATNHITIFVDDLVIHHTDLSTKLTWSAQHSVTLLDVRAHGCGASGGRQDCTCSTQCCKAREVLDTGSRDVHDTSGAWPRRSHIRRVSRSTRWGCPGRQVAARARRPGSCACMHLRTPHVTVPMPSQGPGDYEPKSGFGKQVKSRSRTASAPAFGSSSRASAATVPCTKPQIEGDGRALIVVLAFSNTSRE